MSKEEYPYPDDEFDSLGADRVPQGVHREPTPKWRQWLPYLLVLILVPLLTFGVVRYFAGSTDSAPEPTVQESATPTDDAAEQDDAATEEPEEGESADGAEANSEAAAGESEEENPDSQENGEEEDEELDYSTRVLVLNGARVQGMAGQVSTALSQDGWLRTQADNYQYAAPTVTTLYYTSEDYASEAREVAQRLGIDSLVEDAGAASDGIVIVLRADFSLPE